MNWVKKAESDSGGVRWPARRIWRAGLKALERENRELRQANEILRKASAYFAQAELDRRFKTMIAFIDDHREDYGVEPICKVLPIAPSTYHDHAAKRADPARLSARARRDMALKPEIERVFAGELRRLWRAQGLAAAASAKARASRAALSSG